MAVTVMIRSIPGASPVVSQSMIAGSPMPAKEFRYSSIFPFSPLPRSACARYGTGAMIPEGTRQGPREPGPCRCTRNAAFAEMVQTRDTQRVCRGLCGRR